MPTETEELRLSVTVDDEASAKLVEIQQKVQELSTTSASASKEHLAVSKEIGEAFKKLGSGEAAAKWSI
jgi:hypothetical protein